jgi:predicted regulator of Ras-like GTPase activity (Roadblock/LC7/MglB family)
MFCCCFNRGKQKINDDVQVDNAAHQLKSELLQNLLADHLVSSEEHAACIVTLQGKVLAAPNHQSEEDTDELAASAVALSTASRDWAVLMGMKGAQKIDLCREDDIVVTIHDLGQDAILAIQTSTEEAKSLDSKVIDRIKEILAQDEEKKEQVYSSIGPR